MNAWILAALSLSNVLLLVYRYHEVIQTGSKVVNIVMEYAAGV